MPSLLLPVLIGYSVIVIPLLIAYNKVGLIFKVIISIALFLLIIPAYGVLRISDKGA